MGLPAIRLWFPVLIVLLGGCGPTISTAMHDQADPSATFEAVNHEYDHFKGKIVIWGGVIIGVHNTQDSTWIELLEEPLDDSDRPILGAPSGGRFLMVHDGFLDPAVYLRGRELTVAGIVQDRKNRPLEGVEYRLPVVESKEMILWGPPNQSSFHFGVGVGATIVR